MKIRRLNTQDKNFGTTLKELLAWESVSNENVNAIVLDILDAVRTRGDSALVEYTNTLDRMSVESMAELEIPKSKWQKSLELISAEQRQALEYSVKRIQSYHQHQKQEDWSYTEDDGTVLGQKITALDRVGIYVPGGKAAYPSSVLMTWI